MRLPVTGNAQSPTVDRRVRRITSCEVDATGDGGGWNRRRAGSSRKDIEVPDHVGIGK